MNAPGAYDRWNLEKPDPGVFAVWAVAAVVVLAAMPFWPRHLIGDEGFAESGYLAFQKYFLDSDLGSAFWYERQMNYGSPNPRMGSMILGGVVWLFRDVLTSHPDRVLFFARVVISLLSAGTAALLFDGLRKLYSSTPIAVAGTAALLFHPVFRSCQSLLLPDPVMAFFAAWALRSMARRDFFNEESWRHHSVVLGVALGAAVSCRLYAAALIAPLAVLTFEFARSAPRRVAVGLLVVGALAFLVFAGTNPLFMMNPRVAVSEMTVRHVLRWSQTGGAINPQQFPFIVEIPFSTFRWQAFSPEGVLSNPANAMAGIGDVGVIAAVALTLIGAACAVTSGGLMHVAYFLAGYALVGRVIASMSPYWIVPKGFLIPVMGVCVLQAVAVVRIGRAVATLVTRVRNHTPNAASGIVWGKVALPLPPVGPNP